jgi:uncharacterized protein (TIGR00255 family)
MPVELAACEREFEKRVRERIARGTVELFVKVEFTGARAARPVNKGALASYLRQVREVSEELGCPITVSADGLASLPGVLDPDELSECEAGVLQAQVTAALEAALDEIGRMRVAEGGSLRDELLRHCEAVEAIVNQVQAASPEMLREHQNRLLERVNHLLADTGITVSEQDVAREIAIYADRSNVAEEIARVRSHVEQFREALDQSEPVGRRLEFLAQEMQREVNTMGAKVAGAALSRQLVALHGEVDKIREQVPNVE